MKRNDNKDYYEVVYSKAWKKRCIEYGLDDGVDKIIDIMSSLDADSAFEVGIGTGYPIADSLAKRGIRITGCDISENLINETKRLHSDFELFAGSLWDYEDSEKFDLVYCIRSSWYISDFLDEIGIMLDMCNDNGHVVFNILNSRNTSNKKTRRQNQRTSFIHRVAGAIKVLFLNRNYIATPVLYHYSRDEIESVLSSKGVQWNIISNEGLVGGEDKNDIDNGQKLLFIVHV